METGNSVEFMPEDTGGNPGFLVRSISGILRSTSRSETKFKN